MCLQRLRCRATRRELFILLPVAICLLLPVLLEASEPIALFNGQDLSGWHVQCQPADRAKTFWKVEDGTIVCDSIGRKDHNYVWLMTDREFADFELRLKFQAYRNSPGNSGLQFRSRFDASSNGGWLDGPQVDIHPPPPMTWRTGLVYDETREEKRWVYPSLKDWNIDPRFKPDRHFFKYAEDDDGWNDLVLICQGTRVKTILNGLVVTDWDGTGVLDNSAHTKRNVGMTGHFALQLHSGDELRIRFKDIVLRELADLDPAPNQVVHNAGEFRQAVAMAKPGTRILLAPGLYPGGFHFTNVRGEENKPIIIAAADPANPPVFGGAGGGLQFSRPAFLELWNLVIRQAPQNGLNIDDGGKLDTPAHHVVMRGLQVSDIGPGGNRDAIKLSGVVDFRVEGCKIERWGTGGGSGIDMVGCHRGVIAHNLFRHTETTSSTGIQCKGGTSDIRIQGNRFENAGGRAINIGGSTGLQFFRPPLKPGAAHFEAKDIRVEGNTFVGGGAPVAFVGVDGATVRFNTIYHPKRWAIRILQETREPGFVPSRNGEFADNIIAFDSRDWAEGGVNLGSGTAPETFKFARNWWYCLDQPARSRPRLPTDEADGVYGQPPRFRDEPAGDLGLEAGSPAAKFGADALSKRESQ